MEREKIVPKENNSKAIVTGNCDKDLWSINISREEVESGDLTGTLKSLKLLYSSPVNARHFYERLTISVSGYDNDSRKLYEIPEVREYMALLDEQFPTGSTF